MGEHRTARLDLLRKHQNADGGWGYFPGKQSWLEPTGWAAIALHGDPAADRAWKLMKQWQNADGSCRPCASVSLPNWTAALVVTVGVLRQDRAVVERGVDYLLDTTGADSSLLSRFAKILSPNHTDREPKFKGWPWKPGNSSWVEPTAHGITALRLAGRMLGEGKVRERIESAQDMILNQRCEDGGWNYGARIALGTPLESFPETTGLALIGLAGRKEAGSALHRAESMLQGGSASPLAKAWLSMALRLHGRTVAEIQTSAAAGAPDLLLTAIESVDGRLFA